MPNRFMCRTIDAGYCNQWLRACVGWTNCSLEKNQAPCPGCIASSPLDNPACQDCDHRAWKAENYIENPKADTRDQSEETEEPIVLDELD